MAGAAGSCWRIPAHSIVRPRQCVLLSRRQLINAFIHHCFFFFAGRQQKKETSRPTLVRHYCYYYIIINGVFIYWTRQLGNLEVMDRWGKKSNQINSINGMLRPYLF